jgi:hypothetical protein
MMRHTKYIVPITASSEPECRHILGRHGFLRKLEIRTVHSRNYKFRGLSPRAKYTDRATVACRRS